jgi:CRP-like cAMP-binding protein
MGQSLCRDCCREGMGGKFKLPPFVVPRPSSSSRIDEDGTSSSSYEYDDFTAASGSLRSQTSNHELYRGGGGGDVDPRQRNNRIKNKKSSVKLHAEYRDRQERGILIAPPLVSERVMEYTDNVFTGQDMGVEKIQSSSTDHRGSGGGDDNDDDRDNDGGGAVASSTSTSSSFGDSDYGGTGMGEGGDAGAGTGAGGDGGMECHDRAAEPAGGEGDDDDVGRPSSLPASYVKTPEEDAFLDLALSDDDNFVFDGMSERYRRRLKDSMERVVVPRNTLLIRRGDDPDYLYLILEGEVAVYIDPDEYVDDNAVEIGKHAPLDISVPTTGGGGGGGWGGGGGATTTSSGGIGTPPIAAARMTREFKQSYVLQLRRSLFQSNYNGHRHRHDDDVGGHHRLHRRDDHSHSGGFGGGGGIVGQFLSVIRQSIGGHDSNTSNLTGILEDQACDEDQSVDNFIPLKELRGLKHERDLGTCDVFGELGEFSNM